MKNFKITAITDFTVICVATLLITINSCEKNQAKSDSNQLETTKYCVGKVTGVAPGENQLVCENLKKGDIVCIPCCDTKGCNGIWEGNRRTKLISGICKITVEITDDNDCKTCPEEGKVLKTDPDKDGVFWKFQRKE